ncbi:MAG: RMD1 family protein [Myxococcales bacterium]|nr:MAG: RMD1 family protein [Myxococcales bacterium]
MTTLIFGDRNRIEVTAIFLGSRIELRAIRGQVKLASSPLVVKVGTEGCAVLLRYGAVVFFNVDMQAQAEFLTELRPHVKEPAEQSEQENDTLGLRLNEPEGVDEAVIYLQDFDIRKIQLIGDVLAKSATLSFYEGTVASAFDRIEPLAVALQHHGRPHQKTVTLLKHLGDAMSVQHKMVGRMELGEKPDLLWDNSALEQLFAHLENEYELRERLFALDRKLTLLSHTAQTSVDLVQARHSLRVEWYSVAVSLSEIGVSLYDICLRP